MFDAGNPAHYSKCYMWQDLSDLLADFGVHVYSGVVRKTKKRSSEKCHVRGHLYNNNDPDRTYYYFSVLF